MAQKKKQDVETTGHSWDGIEEFNNPLPKWWLWVFYACIVWGIWYTIAYPAWPGIKHATQGYLGFSTRAEVAEEIADWDKRNAPMNTALEKADLANLSSDTKLNTYATEYGHATFMTWCAQCHGAGAAGALGYPNLQDDDWLWGGSIEDIYATVAHGIRNETDDDARYSEMPAFGRDELLEEEEIDQVVNYVMSLSGAPKDATKVEAGAVVYEDNCASCHMEGGVGDRSQGAPNLADAIWLYGRSGAPDYDAIHETVYNSRYGVMPAWQGRLTDAQVRAVSAYVHQLGGGE